MSRHLEDREETVEMSSHSKSQARGVLLRKGQEIYVAWVLGECMGQRSFLSRGKWRVAVSPKKSLIIHSPNIHWVSPSTLWVEFLGQSPVLYKKVDLLLVHQRFQFRWRDNMQCVSWPAGAGEWTGLGAERWYQVSAKACSLEQGIIGKCSWTYPEDPEDLTESLHNPFTHIHHDSLSHQEKVTS